MAIPKNINNLKDIGTYVYDTNEDGNINISFHINNPGDYKLEINNNTLNPIKIKKIISVALLIQDKLSKETSKIKEVINNATTHKSIVNKILILKNLSIIFTSFLILFRSSQFHL